MILRRLAQHVRAQNWLAVGLDFVIVVVGVFLGIQLGNWNEAGSDRKAYVQALSRLTAEANANIGSLSAVEAEVATTLGRVQRAMTTLRSCDDSTEARAAVSDGLNAIVGTSNFYLQDSALTELTVEPTLLALQSSATREALAAAKHRLSILDAEADYMEALPFRERMEANPIIAVGTLSVRDGQYNGIPLETDYYPLELGAPIDIACNDNDLVKSLYSWHRAQANLPALMTAARAEMSILLEIANTETGGDVR